MSVLDLPSRRHQLLVLGLLVRDGEMRFGEIVKAAGRHDAEIARALEGLKGSHFVRTRTLAAQGKRVILAYGATARGQAAWEAFEVYCEALRGRASVLGCKVVQEIDLALGVS